MSPKKVYQQCAKVVEEITGVSRTDMAGRDRRQQIVWARHLVWWSAFQTIGCYSTIADMVCRHYSGISHGVKAVEEAEKYATQLMKAQKRQVAKYIENWQSNITQHFG